MSINDLCSACVHFLCLSSSENLVDPQTDDPSNHSNEISSVYHHVSPRPGTYFKKCIICKKVTSTLEDNQNSYADGAADQQQPNYSDDNLLMERGIELTTSTSDLTTQSVPITNMGSEFLNSNSSDLSCDTFDFNKNELQDFLNMIPAFLCHDQEDDHSISNDEPTRIVNIDLSAIIRDTIGVKSLECEDFEVIQSQPIDDQLHLANSFVLYDIQQAITSSNQENEISGSEHCGTFSNFDGKMKDVIDDRPKAKRRKKYDSLNVAVYSRATKRKADQKEIKEKISSHYVIDYSAKRPYVCQIDHDCLKFYANEAKIEDHIFGHFFLVPCNYCGQSFASTVYLTRHLITCIVKRRAAKAIEDSTLDRESMVRRKVQLDAWNLPVYSRETKQIANPKEVAEKIKSHITLDRERNYLCQLNHDCRKLFKYERNIADHLFRYFYFAKCPYCGQVYGAIYSLHVHFKSATCTGLMKRKKNHQEPVSSSQEIHQDSSFIENVTSNDHTREKDGSMENTDRIVESGIIGTNQTVIVILEKSAAKILSDWNNSNDQLSSEGHEGLITNMSHDAIDNWTVPIYFRNTEIRCSSTEIKQKIQSSYTKDTNQSFICQIDHICPKVFSQVWHIEDHLFSFFFHVSCPNCEKKFDGVWKFSCHYSKCKEELKSHSLWCEQVLSEVVTDTHDEDETEMLPTSTNEYKQVIKPNEWIHPIYCLYSYKVVHHDEIVERIECNYMIEEKNGKLFYVCLLEHGCYKSWLSKYQVEEHLFSFFFFVPCPKCQKNFSANDKMNQHLAKCKGSGSFDRKRQYDRML